MEFQFHLWPHTRYASFDEIATVVQAAERFGYTAAANGEHIIVPNGPEADLVGPSYFDPMVIFSYLAARTTRIRLQYCAMVVPYRHPALSARGLASIDHASGGRFEVVIGSGWASSEFAALEVPYKSRGPITDEYMDAMRRLWTDDAPSIDGEFVSFGPTTFEPKCVQKPHVPLWIGGTGAAPLRRMAAYGSGGPRWSGLSTRCVTGSCRLATPWPPLGGVRRDWDFPTAWPICKQTPCRMPLQR